MPETSSVWAVVVAAGAGERLAADRPKAFVRFGSRTLVAAALQAFDAHDRIDGVVCVVPPGWEERLSLIADDLVAGKIAAAVAGGRTRADSVRLGLEAVPPDAAFVLVHDAARPLVDEALVDRVLRGLAEGADGVVPAVPLTDTVKRVTRDGRVEETLDRAGLRAAQTPQGFPLAVLRRALRADASRLAAATDCASLVEAEGGRVVVVDGDPRNLKVTTAADLDRARDLYEARSRRGAEEAGAR